MHARTHTHTHTHTHMHTFMHTPAFIHTFTRAHSHVHTHIRTCMYTYAILYIHSLIYICTRTRTHAHNITHLHSFTHLHVRTHTYTHALARIRMLYTSIDTSMHTHTQTHTLTHIHTHTSTTYTYSYRITHLQLHIETLSTHEQTCTDLKRVQTATVGQMNHTGRELALNLLKILSATCNTRNNALIAGEFERKDILEKEQLLTWLKDRVETLASLLNTSLELEGPSSPPFAPVFCTLLYNGGLELLEEEVALTLPQRLTDLTQALPGTDILHIISLVSHSTVWLYLSAWPPHTSTARHWYLAHPFVGKPLDRVLGACTLDGRDDFARIGLEFIDCSVSCPLICFAPALLASNWKAVEIITSGWVTESGLSRKTDLYSSTALPPFSRDIF